MRATLTSLILCGIFASAASADVITQWNFNSVTPDANAATGTTTANIGAGTASLFGGTTATFASGDASGGSTDPATGDDSGWNVTTWPAASAANETAGVQFNVSTVGFQNISVSWDQRHSNSASRFVAFFYTTDGSSYIRLNLDASNATVGVTPAGGNPANLPGLFGGSGTLSAFDGTVTGAGDDWFNGRSVNLSSIAGADNNPNFGFRILSSFGSGTGYVSSSGAAYATTGTWRFDMVTISGVSAVPEPTSMVLLGAAIAGTAGFRFRRLVTK